MAIIRPGMKGYRDPFLSRRQKKQVYGILNKGKLLRRSRQTIASSVGTTGVLQEITQCSEGDDRNNRLSDQITVFKIRVQLSAAVNVATIGNESTAPVPEVLTFRLVIAISKMGQLLASDFPVDTLILPDYDKLIVLYDRTIRKSVFDGSFLVDFRKKLRKKNIPGLLVSYDDDESANAAQVHPIYAYVISSDNTNQPTYSLLSEMWYYDKN